MGYRYLKEVEQDLSKIKPRCKRKLTPSIPKVMRKLVSVYMVNTRNMKEHKDKAMEGPTVPARETDLETPDQSIDGVEKRRRNQHQCQVQKNTSRKQ